MTSWVSAAAKPATRWLPLVPLVVAQPGEQLARRSLRVSPGAAVGHPVEVPARFRHLHREPCGRIAKRHGDVRDHLAHPPARRTGSARPMTTSGQSARPQHISPIDVVAPRSPREFPYCPWDCRPFSRGKCEICREAVQRSQEAGLRLRAAKHLWHVGLADVNSVRSSPRSANVAVTVMPLWLSVQTSRSGSVTSTYTARVGIRAAVGIVDHDGLEDATRTRHRP